MSSARSAAVPFLALALVSFLTGCKSSTKVVVDTATGSNWVKCALGQSFVMESTDDSPTQYGAGTEAWKDTSCANQDTGTLWWDLLDVQARKYNGSTLCDVSPYHSTSSATSVSTNDSDICASGGSSYIHVIGTHGATRPGGGPTPVRELTLTPNVFTF